MSGFSALTGGIDTPAIRATTGTYEQQIFQFILNRVLAFTGHTIDEVINDAGVRYEVTGYYRLCRQVMERCDELAQQLPQAGASKIRL